VQRPAGQPLALAEIDGRSWSLKFPGGFGQSFAADSEQVGDASWVTVSCWSSADQATTAANGTVADRRV